jgi:hypothetical protein
LWIKDNQIASLAGVGFSWGVLGGDGGLAG